MNTWGGSWIAFLGLAGASEQVQAITIMATIGLAGMMLFSIAAIIAKLSNS